MGKSDTNITITYDIVQWIPSGSLSTKFEYAHAMADIDVSERRYYTGENKISTGEQYKSYIWKQMSRSTSKIIKRRDVKHYQIVADGVKNSTFWDEEKSKNWTMICLGARNRWEGLCFKKFLKIDAKTLDLHGYTTVSSLKIDYLMDFNRLPYDWGEKWDIVFSNSIDHAENPTYAFFEWLRILKRDGLLILGICQDGDTVDTADCSSLTEESVEKFIDSSAQVDLLCKLSQTEKMKYTYYLLQKM